MANRSESGQTSRFQLQDLPPEVAKVVDTLKVGQISTAFPMINDQGKTVCVIAKLKSRTEGHKATITEDFQDQDKVTLKDNEGKKVNLVSLGRDGNTFYGNNSDLKMRKKGICRLRSRP